MSNEERAIWNVYTVKGGGYVLRDAAEPALQVTDLLWFVGRTPAFMTKDEAFAWVRALANLGKPSEPQRKSSAWRPCDERPTPEDSPILLRGRTPGAPPCIMAWGSFGGDRPYGIDPLDERPEVLKERAPHWFIPAPDTGPYGGTESMAAFTADELAELMETHQIEWMPLRQSEADNGTPTMSSTWRTDVPLAADSPILLCGTDGAVFVLSWRQRHGEYLWETDSTDINRGTQHTHTEVADMVNEGKLKWRPLDLGGDA